MSAEAPQTPYSPPAEAVAVMPVPLSLGRLVTDAGEYSMSPHLTSEANLQDTPGAPETPEDIVGASAAQPSTESVLQDPEVEAQTLSSAIKDAWYWAGAKFTMLTTTAESHNGPVWANRSAKERREQVALGIGILACMKYGLNFIQAGLELHAVAQPDVINDSVLSSILDTVDGAGDSKAETKEDKAAQIATESLESATTSIDSLHEGLDGATNALINTPSTSRSRKS